MSGQLEQDRVRELFALFTDLSGEELERWAGLCEAARAKLEARLRPEPGDDPADREALCAAAAAWAYSDYRMAGGGSEAGEVRVGDISLGNPDRGARREAEEVRDYFLAGVAHLLLPEGPALLAAGADD